MIYSPAKISTKWDFAKPIEFGTGWTCCIGREAFVIVFDKGERWAVCAHCAGRYVGTVWSLAIFNLEHAVYSYKYLSTMYPFDKMASRLNYWEN